MFAELIFSSPFKKCVFSPARRRASLVKKTFWGGEEKVRVAKLFFSEQNVLGWAGYPMG